jgi:hypothetical protein
VHRGSETRVSIVVGLGCLVWQVRFGPNDDATTRRTSVMPPKRGLQTGGSRNKGEKGGFGGEAEGVRTVRGEGSHRARTSALAPRTVSTVCEHCFSPARVRCVWYAGAWVPQRAQHGEGRH